MAGYEHSWVTVDVEWGLTHLHDPGVRYVEVDWATETYQNSHAPGAVAWTWARGSVRYLHSYVSDKASFAKLMSQSGVNNQMAVVLYGEKDNLWANYAARLLMVYGHENVRLLLGDGKQWLSEHNVATTQIPVITPKNYEAELPNWTSTCTDPIKLDRKGWLVN